MPDKKNSATRAPDDWRPPVRGIVQVTGFPDSGKTTFATSLPGLFPADYHFYDFDGKSQGDADSLKDKGMPYGVYMNMLVATMGMKPLEIFELMDKTVKANLTEKKPKCVVFDNWAPPMEEALRAKAMTIIDKISDISANQAKNMSMLTWPASYRFYSQWLSSIAAQVPVVMIVCHVKSARMGAQKIPGVWESKGQEPLVTLPVFRVWLQSSSEYAGAPTGIVMKRLQVRDITTNGMVPVNATPLKLSPCTWDKIMSYIREPIGGRDLKPEEIPSPFELTLIGGELLPDQKISMKAAAELALREPQDAEAENISISVQPYVSDVKKLGAEGKLPPVIFKELKEKYPDITIPAIVQILG